MLNAHNVNFLVPSDECETRRQQKTERQQMADAASAAKQRLNGRVYEHRLEIFGKSTSAVDERLLDSATYDKSTTLKSGLRS